MPATAARRRPLNIWPGFVDALSALLMVVIFVLMLFTLGQFLLSDALSGRDRTLAQLNAQIAALADELGMEEASLEDMRRRARTLLATLSETTDERDALSANLASSNQTIDEQEDRLAKMIAEVEALASLRDDLLEQAGTLAAALDSSKDETKAQIALTEQANSQVMLINEQLAALRTQLATLTTALNVAETAVEAKDAEISELGEKLNVALANEVRRLAEYQSEFFGRLREALGDSQDLQIVGDRFVFSSELLFDSGSAELRDPGKRQVEEIVETLTKVSDKIPDDLEWVLRIDGHTDRVPIRTAQFPSNWELSTARALAIVNYMVSLGVPAKRLAAAGFGQHHPLDTGTTVDALARNRRIEIKLTAR